jgi:hypothetical protein
VPLEQSICFRERAAVLGQDLMLSVLCGGEHGWLTMLLDLRDFSDWFVDHLAENEMKDATAASPSL